MFCVRGILCSVLLSGVLCSVLLTGVLCSVFLTGVLCSGLLTGVLCSGLLTGVLCSGPLTGVFCSVLRKNPASGSHEGARIGLGMTIGLLLGFGVELDISARSRLASGGF